jgi:crotonobetainyl-CoA:carnitine CoA-transferase CaiB-like acyl-CoA transferase
MNVVASQTRAESIMTLEAREVAVGHRETVVMIARAT